MPRFQDGPAAARPSPSFGPLERSMGGYARRVHGSVGWMMNHVHEPAFLVSVSETTFPVVGASPSFCGLIGTTPAEIVGKTAEEVLTGGSPKEAVSRAANKNVLDFCQNCRELTYDLVSETTVVQPLAKADGGFATMMSLLGMCEIRRRPYVLVVQAKLCDGLMARITAAAREEQMELCREAFLRVRRQLGGKSFFNSNSSHLGSDGSESGLSAPESEDGKRLRAGRLRTKREHFAARGHRRESLLLTPAHGRLPAFSFYSERLQDHCLLSNSGATATRREMDELPTGCLVFSARPVPSTPRGLSFSIRIDSVVEKFEGLPLMGFTRRRPADQPDLFPVVSTCLGMSALIGRGSKAYARDKEGHFKMGFRAPPQSEVETFSQSPELNMQLSIGDVIACTYSWEGRLQMSLNGAVLLDFDVKRPVVAGARYYAVVDVCLSVGACTVLPATEPEEVHAGAARSKPAHLFTDLSAPLAPLMSVGELSTVEVDACGSRASSAQSLSLSSLPSVDTEGGDLPEAPDDDADVGPAAAQRRATPAAPPGGAPPQAGAPSPADEAGGRGSAAEGGARPRAAAGGAPPPSCEARGLTWERLAEHDAAFGCSGGLDAVGPAAPTAEADRREHRLQRPRSSCSAPHSLLPGVVAVATVAVGVALLLSARARGWRRPLGGV